MREGVHIPLRTIRTIMRQLEILGGRVVHIPLRTIRT